MDNNELLDVTRIYFAADMLQVKIPLVGQPALTPDYIYLVSD